MKRTDLQGQWYCDALPTGQYVAVPFEAGGVIKTAHGWTWLPGQPIERLLYVALAPDGVQFGGVGNASDRAWRWDGQRWHDHGLAFGPQAVLFDSRNGMMVVKQPPAHGWRYLDANGQPVTCTETYHDPARQIWQYTDFGDLVIAQGGGEIGLGHDPLIALYQGRRILIQSGTCRFIKARRDGNQLSIAWVQEDAGRASILWLSLSELLTFPDVSSVPSNPSQPPTPPQNPNTPPMPMPDSLAADVARVRARVNGLPTPEQLGQMLNEVAWQHRDKGWGLSRKNGGNRVPFPGGGTIAADILHHKPTDTLWDVFNAATGDGATAAPAWGQTEHHHDPDRPWVAPVQPTGGDDGDPGDEDQTPAPVPQPPPVCNCAALQAQIDALTDRVVQLETQPDSVIAEMVNAKVDAKLAAALKDALSDVARVGYPVRVNLTLSATLRGKIEKP